MNYDEATQEMNFAADLAGSQPLPSGEIPKLRFDFMPGTPEGAMPVLNPWPSSLEQYEVVFALNCLNSWSRDFGKELIRTVLSTGRPLVISVPKILYPQDPVESLWSWSDFTEFGIVHDVSTWHWLIYRLGC